MGFSQCQLAYFPWIFKSGGSPLAYTPVTMGTSRSGPFRSHTFEKAPVPLIFILVFLYPSGKLEVWAPGCCNFTKITGTNTRTYRSTKVEILKSGMTEDDVCCTRILQNPPGPSKAKKLHIDTSRSIKHPETATRQTCGAHSR